VQCAWTSDLNLLPMISVRTGAPRRANVLGGASELAVGLTFGPMTATGTLPWVVFWQR
jgi:hypothetical protein